MPVGAPSYKWTQDIEEEIFGRIAKGEAIRNICLDDWLPSWNTFNKRLATDLDFQAHYAHAREAQADKLFDEILVIADKQEADVVTIDGVDVVQPNVVARSRLQIDARKWMAGKLRPKVYGDKVAIGGADDLPPIKTEDQGVAKLSQYLNAIAERS